jgi:hypothetical protein
VLLVGGDRSKPAEQTPDDRDLRARAEAPTKQQAKRSAEEAGLNAAQSKKPQPVISPELKQAYRQAVKQSRPDLAVVEHERQRRTELD